MNKETVDFVREFNELMEKSNQYCNLQYFTDGNNEAISFPEICLWCDDSMDKKYAKQVSLSNLVKTMQEVLEAAKQELYFEADLFFAEKRKDFSEKFTQAKLKVSSSSQISWNIHVTGKYDENHMYDFLDVMKEDFEYIFEGCKLNFDL